MKRNNKKGFTIVELVIVIAVIAILAAVLIPTFSSVVKKANLSADKQAILAMNKQLAIADVESDILTIGDAVKALDEVDLDLDNYKALTKDHYFYFVNVEGTPYIILADKDNAVVYPENLTNIAKTGWMSLSGLVPMSDDYTVDANGTVAIDDGAKLVHLMEEVKNNKEEVTTINITGNIDLKGAAVDFGTVTSEISIIGSEGATLSGIRADDNAASPTTGDFAGHQYGFGLFGEIESGVTVTIKDVTISSLVVGNTLTDHASGANGAGLIAGNVRSGATLNVENVTIENCILNGYQKVGAIVGYNDKGTVNLKNVDFVNTQVNGYLETAKVVGYCNGNLTVDANCDFSGITMSSTVANEKQIGHSDFTVTAADGATTALVGASDNIFLVGPYKDTQYLWASVTNDWAWYIIPGDRPTVTVPGFDYVKLNGATYSASKNFISGVPQD